MAISHPLPDDDFAPISEGIARYVRGVLSLGPDTTVEMGETFETWSVLGVAPGETRPLSALATFDGRYHHQLFARLEGPEVSTGGEPGGLAPVGAAWSERSDNGSWLVFEVADTWLAAAIDRSVGAVDGMATVSASAVARLLSAPAYGVHALWLIATDQDQVYVIAAPTGVQQVRVGELMTSAAFVQALSRERPIEGLRVEADRF